MPVQQFDYSDADRAAFRADPKLIDDLRYGEQYWSGIYRFNRALTAQVLPVTRQPTIWAE